MIFVPFTQLHQECTDALASADRQWSAEWVGADDQAYWRLLSNLWSRDESFTLVEHDIIPSAEALDSFDLCANEWCACPYPYAGGLYAGLGCTRFREGILRRHPDVMGVVADLSDAAHPPMHWCRLDLLINQVLIGRGEHRCEGHPAVGHLHSVPTHGCTTKTIEES